MEILTAACAIIFFMALTKILISKLMTDKTLRVAISYLFIFTVAISFCLTMLSQLLSMDNPDNGSYNYIYIMDHPIRGGPFLYATENQKKSGSYSIGLYIL